jgi:NTP pyrophosphatase (non-canonical NTP hydrolase)
VLNKSTIPFDMQELTQVLVDFRNARDWEQFHNPKDLALALSIEAAELNEAFLWKKPEEADMEKVREELADVFAYALLLANSCGLDVNEIVKAKVAKNELKYPVDKSKGSAKKYNEL